MEPFKHYKLFALFVLTKYEKHINLLWIMKFKIQISLAVQSDTNVIRTHFSVPKNI